jgi:hypothetical protein
MLMDHNIPPLIEVFQKVQLNDNHIVQTWHKDDSDVGKKVEICLIVPFSNPRGKLPLLLTTVGNIAIILAAYSHTGYHFVTQSTSNKPSDGGSIYRGIGVDIGLWSFNL